MMKLRLRSGAGAFSRQDGQRQTGRSRAGEAGFTLIELLIMLAILGLLVSLTAPRVIGYLGSSKTKTAKVQIENLRSALQLYRLDNGRFPNSTEGLKALVERPANATTWNGPYLTKSGTPLDPWGQPFNYRAPGQHGEFDIFSLGADNQPGGTGENADVNSWD
jgi:general secretion pathway protein G